jgi:HEAT repeat protein
MNRTGSQVRRLWWCGAAALAALPSAAALADGDPAALREAALDTLANIVLVEKNVDETFRNEAVALLGRYGSGAHTAVLLQRLEAAPSGAAAVAAVRALGELGDAAAILVLEHLFVSPETHRTDEDLRWSVSAAAGDALLAYGETGLSIVLAASRGQDAEVRRRALHALAHAGDLAAQVKFTEYADDADRWVRLETAAALGARGDASAVPALKKLLDDAEPDIRLEAARSLARLGDASGEKLLLRSSHVKADEALALRLLARLDPSKHLPALLEHLKNPVNETELDDVAALLAACETEQYLPALIAACADDQERLRANAAALLGRLGQPEATQTLTGLLRDPSWDVRAQAAKALGVAGFRSAVPSLNILADQLQTRRADPRTRLARRACAIALVRLGKPDSAVPLCLVKFGPTKRMDIAPDVAALVGGEEVERVLIESVRQPDPGQPPEHLLDALRALELMRSRAAAMALEELLRERPYAQMHALDLPEVWAALLDALGGCAGPAAAKTAATYADDETPIVRLAACRAILRLTTQETSGD